MRTPTTAMILLTLAIAGCAGDVPTTPPSASEHAAQASAFPEVIALPNGFFPEGIDFGRGTTFYVGSLATGAIFRGDARTGTGDLLVPAQPGREAVGLKYDQRSDRLFVAGGFTGQAYVYDASTGATLAVYPLADPADGATLVNDVVVLKDAAYFTDSFRPVIYRVPLGKHGALPPAGAVEEIPLTGDFEFIPDAPFGNANGIAATPNGKQLIVVNMATGKLYLVDPETGRATEIDLGGGSVPDGDGILLLGHTLYVVQGPLNQIAVVRLSPHLTSGVIERAITDPDLQFPSTIARFGSALYAVNARFDVEPGPEVEYQVVRVSRPPPTCTSVEVASGNRLPAGTMDLGIPWLGVGVLNIESYLPRPTAQAEDVRIGASWESGTPAMSFEIGDFNGDGRRDIVLRYDLARLMSEGNLSPATRSITVWGRDRATGTMYCGTALINVVP
ncbi:hypothetical protein BH24GEM3_BH24GEM3_11190 [soil metagenome]